MTPTPAGRLAFLLPNMRGGGAERVALGLMADFVARGHLVDLLVMAADGELMPLLPPGVRVIPLQASRIRDVIRPLIRYLRTERPLGVQAFMWPLTVAAVVAHRLTHSRARLVLSDHTTLSRQYGGRGTLVRQILRRSIAWAYPLADSRVCVSKDAARDLAALAGLPPATIETIYNPVPTPHVDETARLAALAAWPLKHHRLLTVGALIDVKNHRLLIDAFARLSARRTVALVILGDGPLRGQLAAQIEAAGLADTIAMPGFVTDPAPFFAAADLFALSSDYEGYGNVLVEALHAGLRVVSTDCESGPREILAGGRYGRLVPCGNAAALAHALGEVLDQPHDATAMRTRADALSGREAFDRYLHLMTGNPRPDTAEPQLADVIVPPPERAMAIRQGSL